MIRKEAFAEKNNSKPVKVISLGDIIKKSTTKWTTPEWGFPKGRRNLKESNLDCSRREFMEETGLESTD